MAGGKRQRQQRKAGAKGRESPKARLPSRARRTFLPRWLWFVAAAALVLALGVALALVVTAEPPPGRSVAIQGAEHVRSGESHPPYNTVPPTSGWHYAGIESWGIHKEPIPDELQVHNLEHGGIIVQYNCSAEPCPGLVAQLEAVVSRYPSKVVLAPYPSMAPRIALTAWGHIHEMQNFDERTIVRFIEAFKNKGPEKVPD